MRGAPEKESVEKEKTCRKDTVMGKAEGGGGKGVCRNIGKKGADIARDTREIEQREMTEGIKSQGESWYQKRLNLGEMSAAAVAKKSVARGLWSKDPLGNSKAEIGRTPGLGKAVGEGDSESDQKGKT